jgi:hypothetical protein
LDIEIDVGAVVLAGTSVRRREEERKKRLTARTLGINYNKMYSSEKYSFAEHDKFFMHT